MRFVSFSCIVRMNNIILKIKKFNNCYVKWKENLLHVANDVTGAACSDENVMVLPCKQGMFMAVGLRIRSKGDDWVFKW